MLPLYPTVWEGYLIVDMVSADGNRVHDKLPPLVVTGSAVRDVVGIVLCSEVMAQLMSGHQICLLMGHKHQIYWLWPHIVLAYVHMSQ